METRSFNSVLQEVAFNAGFESKVQEVKGMGWNAARDKFNLDYPPGKPWDGSQTGLAFAKGEFAALEHFKKKTA